MKNWKEIVDKFNKEFSGGLWSDPDSLAVHMEYRVLLFMQEEFKEILEEMVGEGNDSGGAFEDGYGSFRQEMLDKIKAFFEENENQT